MKNTEYLLLCITIPLIILLPFVKDGVKRFCIAFLAGNFACIVGAYVNSYVMYSLGMTYLESVRFVTPIIEEFACLIPICVFALTTDVDKRHLISFGAVVGAGFATFENVCYIAQNEAGSLKFVLVRGTAAGVMHVVCGLILGVGLYLVYRYISLAVPVIAGALSFSVVLHAIYNLYVSKEGLPMYVGLCIPLVCAAFILFFKIKFSEKLSKSENSLH